METTKSLNRDEINRNCERTLTLLRSNKPDAADLMLNMLNDSILKRYGDGRQVIDISKFTKLNSDDSKVPNKKAKLKKIKKEKNQKISKNETKLNEMSNDVTHQKIRHVSNEFNSKMSKHNKSKTKIMKNENNIKLKNNFFEKDNTPSDEVGEITNNTSQTLTTNRNLNIKTKSNIISKHNENSENSIGIQESKINDIQNTEKSQSKGENESFGISSTVKRLQLQHRSTSKVKNHKKPPLHELSSRQRIQAVLEKRINNK
ncbi:unnamed protein product [Nezara viridula]|uniref:Uncharacterized protein n=1 Tax=Nezara viridula TaxID=85310 RepID=A0A9P0HCU3_NEZVI|nr:unnamed protein product [Nezara viridula]